MCSQMKIISVSRRTDIPAFYGKWFMQRIRAGHVRVMSPFSSRVSTVSLSPENVIAIVFWTKNAQPLLRYLPELKDRGYPMYFLYTINNYPKVLEPDIPNLRLIFESVEKIRSHLGAGVIRWRYDPVVITSEFSINDSLKNFDHLCSVMKSYTVQCIFSFCDYYKKTIRKMTGIGLDFSIPGKEDALGAALEMAAIANSHGIGLVSCAHDYLAHNSITRGQCIDRSLISNLIQSQAAMEALSRLKPARSRQDCGCLESFDIGAYNTCYHGCVYCYATTTPGICYEKFCSSLDNKDYMDPRFEKTSPKV